MNGIVTDKIDVTSQFNYTGEIIPMRIRFQDSDGEYRNYTIKRSRALSSNGGYKLPNGISCTCNIKQFECKLEVLGYERTVMLYYDESISKWKMAF